MLDPSPTCPTCGRPYPNGLGVAVTPAGTAEFNGLSAELTDLEITILRLLLRDVSKPLSRQAITEACFPGRPYHNPRKVDAQICRLRRKLFAIGLEIRTIRSRGYRLMDPALNLRGNRPYCVGQRHARVPE